MVRSGEVKVALTGGSEAPFSLGFLKAWEAIGRYKWCGYPFSSWLYKLAHNLVVDHYRTRREVLPLNELLAKVEAQTKGRLGLGLPLSQSTWHEINYQSEELG